MSIQFGVKIQKGKLSKETVQHLIENRKTHRECGEYEIADEIRTYLRTKEIYMDDKKNKWWSKKGMKGNIIETSETPTQTQVKKSKQKPVYVPPPSIHVSFTVIVTVNVIDIHLIGDKIKDFPIKLSQLDKTTYTTEITIKSENTPVKRNEVIGNLRRTCIIWLRDLGEISISPISQMEFTKESIIQSFNNVPYYDFSNISSEWKNTVATLSITQFI